MAKTPPNNEGQYSAKETEQRFKKILRGAFAGPPTHLKDIPKKNGGSRQLRGKLRLKNTPKRPGQ